MKRIALVFIAAAGAFDAASGQAAIDSLHIVPFDTTVTQIKAEMLSSASAIFRKFLLPPKDEFEPTVAYRQRARALLDTTILAVAVVQDTTRCGSPRFNYDADKQRMGLWHSAGGPAGAQVLCELRIDSTYTASNAYGQTVQVVAAEVWFRSVSTVHTDMLVIISGNWKMEPNEARARKENLALLVIFRPALSRDGDLFGRKTNTQEATITRPQQLVQHDIHINSSLLKLWVFDRSDGTIVQKFDYTKGLPGRR
jgi:hypothetical protein